jgi:hypothetical protein
MSAVSWFGRETGKWRKLVGSGMRALTALTIVMGVLILVGTAVLVAVVAHRMSSPASGGVPVAAGAPLALVLDEPAGTHIAGVAAAADWLAVRLQGGGVDRVVLVDPRSGAVTGRIALAR